VGARSLATVGAVFLGCAGPAPAIEHVEVAAPRLPGRVRVALVVVNHSGGHGQVQIEIALRATRPGRTVVTERPLELDGHQRVELTVDIPAPDGDYVVEARAIYPD
jgi:hypothetical protein